MRDLTSVLSELARVKALFQLRTIAAVIGAPMPRMLSERSRTEAERG